MSVPHDFDLDFKCCAINSNMEGAPLPTIHREKGFRFFFYSNEGLEPPHVHCQKQKGEMKIWLRPVHVDFAHDMSPKDQKAALELVATHRKKFTEKWHEFAGKKR